MRLTIRDYFNIEHYTTKELATELDCIDKLGQLEDIEEELGIDLVTLFKALNNGVWEIDDYTKKIKQTEIRGIELYGLCAIWSPTIPECDYTLKYQDYGKTWALTKEELENV